MSHGIPENRIVCQTGKHVVPFRLDFVSISDRKDRAIELTESKFYIKSRRQLESEREGTRRFEAPINEDRGDAEWRERMLHWEGEPLSQWMNRPSREKANVRMEHRNSTKMRLGARPPELCLSLWSGANNLRIRFGKSFDRSISRYWYSRNQTARLVPFRLLEIVNTRCIYVKFSWGKGTTEAVESMFFPAQPFQSRILARVTAERRPCVEEKLLLARNFPFGRTSEGRRRLVRSKGNQRRNYSHPNHERSRIVPLNRVTNYYGTSRLQSDQRPLNIILLDAGSGDLKRTVHESRERDRPDILIRFKPRLPNKGSTARTNPSHPSELWTAGARNYFHGCTLRTDHRYLLPRTCPLRSTESQPDREAKFFFSKEPKGRKFLYEFEQRVY